MAISGQLFAILIFVVLFITKGINSPRLLLGAYTSALTRVEPLASFITAALIVVAIAGPIIMVSRGWAPSYRRIRAIERPPLSRRLRVLAAGIVPLIIWFVVIYLVNTYLSGAAQPVAIFLLLFVFITLMPFVRIRLLPTKPLSGDARERAMTLARRAGVRVADIRVMDTSGGKVANAFIMGPFARARYIVLTDFLLDQFTPEEVDAVISHELGHAKRHDVPIKTGVFFGGVLITAVGIAALAELLPKQEALGIVLSMALFIGLVVIVGGKIGMALERRADDYGADLQGVDAMTSALEHLAVVNTTKRRTSRFWGILTQHPGVEERVQRLRARATPQKPDETGLGV